MSGAKIERQLTGKRGAMANQIKNAVKKPIHEQWKARMCGRLKERSLISVPLSSWFGSTLTWYTSYFLISACRDGLTTFRETLTMTTAATEKKRPSSREHSLRRLERSPWLQSWMRAVMDGDATTQLKMRAG